MRNFISVSDIGPLDRAVAEALEVKANRFAYKHLGENRTLMMIFFNSSLRTRLSTQKAALNLGMHGNSRPNAESSWTATSRSTCLRQSL